MSGKILVGTASWSDPGYVADWYPRSLPANERLSWYAGQFNLVELNSSFYAIPSRRLVQRWSDQTPPGFTFDVKLHRLLSRHATKPDSLPRDLRSRAVLRNDKIALTPEIERAVAERFLEEIQPFRDTGKLGALLLQLSPSFQPRTHPLTELDGLLEILKGYPLAVELRNRDWVVGEQVKETEEFFRKRKITFVSVDAPQQRHFTVMPKIDLITSPRLAYIRCHGRNAKGYISGRSVAERFDYQYSDAELEEIVDRAADLAEGAARVHVIYNNNASNYAPVSAHRFREILGEKYPELEAPAPSRLALEREEAQPLELELGDQPKRRSSGKPQLIKK